MKYAKIFFAIATFLSCSVSVVGAETRERKIIAIAGKDLNARLAVAKALKDALYGATLVMDEIFSNHDSEIIIAPNADLLAHLPNNSERPSVTPTHIAFLISQDETSNERVNRKLIAHEFRYDAFFIPLDVAEDIERQAFEIIAALKHETKILDPRKMASGDKLSLRTYYETWKQRENVQPISGTDYIVIRPAKTAAPVFDTNCRKLHQCHFNNIGKVFEYDKFSEPRHPPVLIGVIEKKEQFDNPLTESVLQPQDMPIAFPTDNKDDYEYRLPVCYQNLQEFVEKVANTWHSLEENHHRYYAYLSISHGVIPPWQNQRRPNIHTDGFQGARVEPKEIGEYTFVVANKMPTIFYIESFDTSTLDPNIDNFFSAYSRLTNSKPLRCMEKYQIMMMDPYCFHAATTNYSHKPVTRTFARIIFSTRRYDREGNAHNPAFNYQWEMVKRDGLSNLNL